MKNSTKLIMETWRKFLKEGDVNEEGQYSDPDEQVSGEPISDEDLEGDQTYYNPASEEPPEGFYDEDYNEEGFDPDTEDQSYYSPASEEPSSGFYDEDYNEEGFDPDAEDQSYYNPASEEPPEGFYDEDYNEEGFDPDAEL